MKNSGKQTIVFILGPTASGKSETAVRFAEIAGGEIISCDSMQVYSGMEILTQAPSPELMKRVRHHLVGVISLLEEFSAASFAESAIGIVDRLILEGKTPVISGGTGLYAKALIDGLFPSPPKDSDFRAQLERQAAEKGNMFIYEQLKRIDPEAALKIDPQNIRRVIRALEVFKLTGKTFSEKKTETKGLTAKYDVKLFALKVNREVLVERIDKRVEEMFAGGLIEEVESLMGRDVSLTASKALGISEVLQYVLGEISIEQAKEELKIKTRQYAKRQMTWLRSVDGIEWIDAERPTEKIAQDIALKTGFKP